MQKGNRLYQAIELIEAGDHGPAELILRNLIDDNPDDHDAWRNLGFSLMSQSRLAEAEAAYRTCVEIMPEYGAAWGGLADVLDQQGMDSEAEEALIQWINLAPDDVNALYSMSQLLMYQSRYQEAEDFLRRAYTISPDDQEILLDLITTLKQSKSFTHVEEVYIHHLELVPDDSYMWNEFGMFLGDNNQWPRSEECFIEAVNIAPDDAIYWYHLGVSQLEQEFHNQALASYLEAISLDPNNPLCWNNLGVTYVKTEHFAEAHQAYSQALQLDPTDAYPLVNFSLMLHNLNHHDQALETSHTVTQITTDTSVLPIAWYIKATSAWHLGHTPDRIHADYLSMSGAIERLRIDQANWDLRLGSSFYQSRALGISASYCIDNYPETAIELSAQSKARLMNDLLIHSHPQLGQLLSSEDHEEWQFLIDSIQSINTIRSSTNKTWALKPETLSEHDTYDIQARYDTFRAHIISDKPELEPFFAGPAPRKSRFSLSRLQKKLGQGEAFLEFKFRNSEPTVLMAFLVTTDGIVATNVWYQDEPRSDSDPISLQDWFDEVLSVLGVHPQAESRATHMLSSLSNDVLGHWGNILFGPFADHLTDIHRLWISPDSFTTQIPFASLPFPDCIEREVAITPSADMFLKPTSRSPRPKPRFTLGVLAADTGDIPLKLQKAETALLRKTVSTPSRRWELSENLPGMEPTLTNLRNIQGLTRCLVISCHGFGPHSDWGTLSIGTTDNPHHVTGRELVDRFLLGDNIGQMEVDLLITSACLTSQIDIDRPEEWLGLPLALQTIWKTRTMILTLWEVAELPSVLWTHSIVNLLTRGIPVGRAFHMAQKQLRDMTRDEASLLLSSILNLLPDPQKGRAASEWADFISKSDNCPFQDPVHWAPFTLIGDPSLKISRSRQMDL